MIGKTISHYKILEKLGAGGMGVVYKAEDTKLKRIVALKFLPGVPLKKKVNSGRLSVESVLDYGIQIVDGLQAAHEHGIVHRDIKCDNVMVTEKGVAKIMDFGLAKLQGRTQVTREGTTPGTVSYMSPEQAQGAKIDRRTDIWAFGVVLYEMLTGQLPFKGDYEQVVVYSIMNEDPEPLTALFPSGWSVVCCFFILRKPSHFLSVTGYSLRTSKTMAHAKGIVHRDIKTASLQKRSLH